MDVISLVSTAMLFLKPFFKKSGEKVAEEIGSSLWTWLGDRLSKKKELPVKCSDVEVEEVQTYLESELVNNPALGKALEAKLQEIQSSPQGQMIIENKGTVEKQVNITNMSGGTIKL
jgi:hypothetical protein